MRHVADMLQGPIGYLGHFAQRRFLVQGHNDVSLVTSVGNAGDYPNARMGDRLLNGVGPMPSRPRGSSNDNKPGRGIPLLQLTPEPE